MSLRQVIDAYKFIDSGGYLPEIGLEIDEEEYNIFFDSIDIDIVMSEFDEDQIEWASFLFGENIPYYLFGGEFIIDANYNIPVIEGNFTREDIVRVAESILNHPYQWGGKSPRVGPPEVGLDCSGYIDWVFVQLTGKTVGGGGGTASQYQRTLPISRSELKLGDLGFYYTPNQVPAGRFNHVGIFIGRIGDVDQFIHCGGRTWASGNRPKGRVIISDNNTGYEKATKFNHFRRVNIQYTNE